MAVLLMFMHWFEIFGLDFDVVVDCLLVMICLCVFGLFGLHVLG